MKVIELLNKIANGEEDDLITEFEFDKRVWNFKALNDSEFCLDGWLLNQNITITKHKEIIEEKKKFTKEDFINERMGIDKITRKEFDEMYEVKECNCGMPYCKGFIAVDKEEPQEHKIPEKLCHCYTDKLSKKFVIKCINDLVDKINEILDYLKEIK